MTRVPSVKVAIVGLLVAAGVVMMLGLAHVGRRQEVIRLGYELSKATEHVIRAQEENRRLRLEKATLTSPERIGRLARSLGMVPADPSQIRVVGGPDALAAATSRAGLALGEPGDDEDRAGEARP